MAVSQTKKNLSGLMPVKPVAIPKHRLITFIKDDLSLKALNQIRSLQRRRDFTKNTDFINFYNERIDKILLHEFKKKV